jgi:Predicted site-specific integrase-resolvase
MKLYTVSEFAEKLGVSVTTLRTWDKEGKLVALRTPTNKRRYTEEMFYRALGIKNRQEPKKIVYTPGYPPPARSPTWKTS